MALAGWSLGSVVAQALAGFLSQSLVPVRVIVVLEARNRAPFLQSLHQPRDMNWRWMGERQRAQAFGGSSRDVFADRRMTLWLSQSVPRARSHDRTLECHSGLLRSAEAQASFQADAAVHERSDVYSVVAAAVRFPDTDHYVLAVQNSWDIAHFIRAAALKDRSRGGLTIERPAPNVD